MPARAWAIGGLFAAELVLIVIAFQVLAPVECRLTGIEAACRALRGAMLRAMCLGALVGVWLWAVPRARAAFAGICGARAGGRGWALTHALAVVAVFAPLALIAPDALNARFAGLLPVLGAGGLIAALAGLFWLAPPGAWAGWLRGRVGSLGAIAALALVLPDIAAALGPLWYWKALTETTFATVAALVSALPGEVIVLPDRQIIGIDGFAVAVADSCSGIEGFALITAFMGVYAWLFRDTLRMGRFWGVVLPLALMASWMLNVVRIAALLLIGAHVSPDLAQNGFHSFAGWLFFIVLAFAVLVVADRVAWLGRDGTTPAAGVPLAEDEAATRIVPFIVFLLSGVIAQAFWSAPELAFPLQAAMMAAALWWARRGVRRALVRPDAVAVAAGAAVGAGWVWLAPETGAPSAALMALSPVAFALWAGVRILGTSLMVPVIEEMFFRGYLQGRLDTGGWRGKALAIAVPTALFAALHGRWLEAGAAGLVFALVAMRRGRVGDAIVAHMVANALVAAVAAGRGNWGLV